MILVQQRKPLSHHQATWRASDTLPYHAGAQDAGLAHPKRPASRCAGLPGAVVRWGQEAQPDRRKAHGLGRSKTTTERIEMLTTIMLSVLSSLAGYRGALMLTAGAPVGSMRASINRALGGGGPGPV